MRAVKSGVAITNKGRYPTYHLTVGDTRIRLRVPCPMQTKGYVRDGEVVFTGAGVCTLTHQRSVEEPWTSPWAHPYRRRSMTYWSS